MSRMGEDDGWSSCIERARSARRLEIAVVAVCALVSLAGCRRAPRSDGPVYHDQPPSLTTKTYHFAVHPLHNPQKLIEAYQPLIDHLNRHLSGARMELEASRDYQAFEAKLRARVPEFVLPNPWQTLLALKAGYGVMAMAGDAEDFTGLFITRKDSGIKVPGDLKGKAVSYPSPTALAACVMPQFFLHTHGIDVNRDVVNLYVGSQESSIMNAYLGKSAVAATWRPPWRLFQQDHPQEASQLTVVWETPSLVNNAVMARGDVPVAVRDRVRVILLELPQDPAGRAILAGMQIARFHPADDDTYTPVREYVARFEREVRPVEPP